MPPLIEKHPPHPLLGDFERKNMGKAQRVKGLSFERKIAKLLRPIFPNAKRHLEFQYQEADGYDLDNTGNYRIQCKKHKKYVSINCIKEIQLKSEDEIPILVTAGDGQEPMAVMPFEHFLKLLENSLLEL